jgi:SAM-dependent methyltransferase
MKQELLDYLRCPQCGATFGLVVLAGSAGWIDEGLLCCRQSRHLYPIVRAIPRLISTAFEQERDFADRYHHVIASYGLAVRRDALSAAQHGTSQSFGREWTTYQVQRHTEDNAYFSSKTGVTPSSLDGKLVLDVGCGSGRYVRVAAEAGATVIGADLSMAVETAAATNAHLPNAHIVQGDIFSLPFAPATFDFVYSIGVLHHTPNTHQAFDRLPPLVKPGGELAVWLYPRWPAPIEAYNNLLRGITTHMSLDALQRLSTWLEPVGLLKLRLLTSPRRGLRGLGQLLRGLTIGVSYHPDRDLRICDTFDWFSPPYQWHHTDAEVENWFRGAGLTDIVNLSIDQAYYQYNYGIGVNFRARRPPASSAAPTTVIVHAAPQIAASGLPLGHGAQPTC